VGFAVWRNIVAAAIVVVVVVVVVVTIGTSFDSQ